MTSSNYIIAIGGSGCKIVESIVHCCSAGVFKNIDFKILIIEPDNNSPLKVRAINAIDSYKKFSNREFFKVGNCELFSNKIELIGVSAWNPINEHNKSLFLHYGYENLDVNLKNLFDILFSDGEKITELDGGFRGHPCIGNAIFTNVIDFTQEPWRKFKTLIDNEINSYDDINILIAGSVFGGTGASGIPSVAKKIKLTFNPLFETETDDSKPEESKMEKSKNIGDEMNENLQSKSEIEQKKAKINLAGLLVLPYYKFIKKGEHDNQMRVLSSNYLINTQTALKYYYSQNFNKTFKKVYFIGDPFLSQTVEDVPYGDKQCNPPNVIELLGVSGILDFFINPDNKNSEILHCTTKSETDKVYWNDIPHSDIIRNRISIFLYFIYSYLSTYSKIYSEIQDTKSKKIEYFPFVYNIFKKEELSETNFTNNGTKINIPLTEYFNDVITWIYHLNESRGDKKTFLIEKDAFKFSINKVDETGYEEIEVNGFNYENFAKFVKGNFDINSKSEIIYKENELHKIWDFMCSSNHEYQNSSDFGRYIRAIYESNKNYFNSR